MTNTQILAIEEEIKLAVQATKQGQISPFDLADAIYYILGPVYARIISIRLKEKTTIQL